MKREIRPRFGPGGRIRGGAVSACLGLLLLAVPLRAEIEPPARTIRVPQDYPLLSQAVAASGPSDLVEVDDGYYFERNLVLDKPLTIRSRNLFGAVIYGSMEPGTDIFIVRAPVDISGFVLRDSNGGIRQRDSPDVEWTGHDLAFIGLKHAVYIDDRFVRIGSARLSRLIFDRCGVGISTNEARSIKAKRCFAGWAQSAFSGSNHESFQVDQALIWDSAETAGRDDSPGFPTGGTNRIDLGPDVRIFGPNDPEAKRSEFLRRLKGLFTPAPGEPSESRARTRRRDSLLLAMTGRALLDAGDTGGAKACFQEALIRAEETGVLEARWQALLGLARAAEKLGDGRAAADGFQRAIGAVEEVASRFPRGYLSVFLGDKIGLYEALVGHLLAGHEKIPGEEAKREAFLWADRSKARGVRTLMARAESGRMRSEAAYPAEAAALDRGVNRVQAALLDPDLTPTALAARLRRLDEAEARRLSFRLRIRAELASASRESAPPPPDPSFAELQTLVSEGSTALLEYIVGSEGSWAFLMTRDGLSVAPLPAEDRLQILTTNYLRFLTNREPRVFQGWTGGADLRRSLMGPFEGILAKGIKRLIVVPDGPLHDLPFEALPGGTGGRRFLVEDFEIAYAASAALLADLKRRGGPAAYRMDFLGLAAPEPFRIWRLAEGGPMRFPALPFAAGEVRTIGRMFPRAKRTILTGRKASELRLKALPLGDYRVIHIAAHGFFQDGRWWRSAMRLRGEPDAAEDGLLQPADIESLRLPSELVVLSGCRTGSGEFRRGEGLEGLTGSFFSAGARSLLLSLWSVNDRATARFMKTFYKAWTEGRTKEEALRRAKILALSKGEPPFVWGAFVLMGG